MGSIWKPVNVGRMVSKRQTACTSDTILWCSKIFVIKIYDIYSHPLGYFLLCRGGTDIYLFSVLIMKKFLIKLSYTLFPLWLMVVGSMLYVNLHVIPRISGDLGALGLYPFGHQYDFMLEDHTMKDCYYPTINSIEEFDSIHIDVLTIGDSFSQQGRYGYQNYLSKKGLTVANFFRNYQDDPFLCAYYLLDDTCVHTVVIESVETYLERRIVDFSIDKAENYLQKTGSNPIESNNVNNNDPNSWSLLRVRDYFYYRLFKNESPICIEKLNNDYFSCDKPDKLFFYRHNITCGVSIRKDNEVCVRNFFNLLCEKAKEKGVSLILLIAVDKYDLYQSYIIDNEWPTKTVM